MGPSFSLVFGVVVLISLGLWVANAFFGAAARARREIREQREVPIRDAPEGQRIKIAGRASPETEPMSAPLSGRSCVCWKVLVEEYRSQGTSGGYWKTLIEDYDSKPFFVEDRTGRAIVKEPVADLLLVHDGQFNSGTLNDASPALEAFLSSHGESSTGILFNRRLRYSEGAVEPGEVVVVVGVGQWELDPDPSASAAGTGYREAPRRLVVGCLEDGRLIVSDDPSVA